MSADFNAFQIISLVGLAALCLLTVEAGRRKRASLRAAALWLAIWIVAAFLIAVPSAATGIANALGVGRGADLVSYVAVLLMFAGFMRVYLRLRALERDMTKLVRHIALLEGPVAPESDGTP